MDEGHGKRALKSPMRTFWLALLVSAAVLLIIAWLIGRYGLSAPVTGSAEAGSLNIAIWSLVVTSVVALAGSITAVVVASAANNAQQHSTRLQAIDVYHNHPAYEKARRVSDAYISARSTLRLIVTGLDESRNHALAHSVADARPMINRWRTFADDIHRSVFESELYSYLLTKNPDRSRLVAHSVATLLATADELEAIVATSKEFPGHQDAARPDALARALFSRNAMAYVASGLLLQLMSRTPAIEELFQEFGGDAAPYTKSRGDEASDQDASVGLEHIWALSSEAFVRIHRSQGLAAVTSQDAANSLADALRSHYDLASDERADKEEAIFRHRILVDLWLPYVDQAIDDALAQLLRESEPDRSGFRKPALAERTIRLGTLDQCVDYLAPGVVPEEIGNKHSLRSLMPLLPETGGLYEPTRTYLDAIAAGLAQQYPQTFFVFELRNELQQAEILYLASKLEMCLIIWTGWPYVPNENVAFETLLEQREFTHVDRAGHFSFQHPVIFTGALPLWGDPSDLSSNLVTRKLRDLAVGIQLVSDL